MNTVYGVEKIEITTINEQPIVKSGDYTTEETRVHSKKIAPPGNIFLVVKAKGKGFKCSNHLLVPFGLTSQQKHEAYERLYNQLQTKYGV